MTRKRSIVTVLALAVAVSSALAAEQGGRAKPRREQQRTESRRTEPPVPSATPPLRDVLQSLEHLRLHPGEDGLDVAQTARKRPEPPPD